MNMVSECCGAEIIVGTHVEYPLGGQWGMTFKTTICDKCHEECYEAAACEMCGELLDMNDSCPACTNNLIGVG